MFKNIKLNKLYPFVRNFSHQHSKPKCENICPSNKINITERKDEKYDMIISDLQDIKQTILISTIVNYVGTGILLVFIKIF